MKNTSYYKNIVEILALVADDKKLLEQFLDDLLTPQELEDVSIRWEIVKRLHRGETHRAIADNLGVGIATVTRGSRELRDAQGGFAKVLKKYSGK
jgi:TrpR family trp operon transcriptional repressor